MGAILANLGLPRLGVFPEAPDKGRPRPTLANPAQHGKELGVGRVVVAKSAGELVEPERAVRHVSLYSHSGHGGMVAGGPDGAAPAFERFASSPEETVQAVARG